MKPDKPQSTATASPELLKVIIEEVDEAREVLELAQQLAPALPLRSFEDVHKAVDKGKIIFRGNEFNVRAFTALVPTLFFPIDDLQKLVALLYETVRLAPTTVAYNPNDPSHAARRLRRLGIVGMLGKMGQLGAPPGGAIRAQCCNGPVEKPKMENP